ncbi:DNA polymerase [Nocardia wallacei]|uniref:DNA polymerase n=1 Tax=Nocardia wallacei TaxID=480035 RepID=UPI003CC7D1AF
MGAPRAGAAARLGRTGRGPTAPRGAAPPAGAADPALDPGDGGYGSTSATRARGRFTRNFVVQGSAADWALLVLAALRRELASAGLRAELVFFQHDEVIVHCPAAEAATVAAAIGAAADIAGRLAFGPTPVRFPFTTAVVECYWDAK